MNYARVQYMASPGLTQLQRLRRLLVCLVWFAAVALGFGVLAQYDNTPGKTGASPIRWPETCNLPAPAGRPKLLMFAHPHCPCTKASIGELARLMAHCRSGLEASVFFVNLDEAAADRTSQSENWKAAAAIPGVDVAGDPAGSLAQKFGARTSGCVLLYDSTGQLVFRGGITASRGHYGDNAGSSAIESFVKTGHNQQDCTPVFGCGLFNCPER